jgi:hypothetical protein
MTDTDYKRRYRNGPRLKKITARWKALMKTAPLRKLDDKVKVQILLLATDGANMDRTFVKEKCALDAGVPDEIPDDIATDAGEE